ncbi:Golgi SNAP receptor complex member 1-2-like isoform X1 [Iris pallida]|uniref:Golgi SNAP receptor complex member 1-2-like isoform X1 n=1 Tax=Iris pallida TaxID=29817 RepID=A0AAX6DH57_IRIPA|nr:Golgi SNAP receptor complex member 1-2-like isoform X1 [Iris pallida]
MSSWTSHTFGPSSILDGLDFIVDCCPLRFAFLDPSFSLMSSWSFSRASVATPFSSTSPSFPLAFTPNSMFVE